MPNVIAYLVLFAWPLFAKKIRNKVSVADAAILLFLVPYLLLPVKTGVDLPLLPMIDKETLASIMALLLLRKPLSEVSGVKFTFAIKACWLAVFGGMLGTTMLNDDPLIFEQNFIPGMRLWDYIGVVFARFFSFFVPFYIGYKLLNSIEAHKRVTYWIVLGGLAYLLPMLWEVRMSPQLHAQIYGFFPHDFAQQMRDGGFRPVVFLGHGLLVAFYAFSACICALAWQQESKKIWRLKSVYVLLALAVGVVACKTLSAVFYLVLGCTLILLVPSSKKYMLMCLLALSLLFYPALRTLATPSLDWFAQKIEEVKPERAQSLRFRLDNEEGLLHKAQERAWFGWGSWGRNHIYDRDGRMTSVTDGVWIIVFGGTGWIGYLGFFGLLILPFWSCWRATASRRRDLDNSHSLALLVILLFNLVDFIPNSSLSHITFLLAGALAGAAAQIRAKSAK